MSKNPVVQVAKERDGDIHTLSTGVSVRLKPYNGAIVMDAIARIDTPKPPLWYNPDKDREEENPNDPGYLAVLEAYNVKRGKVGIDVAVMFGMELVDGMPEDKSWIKKLRLVGHEFDASDEVELEFVYKKHIAIGNQDDMRLVTRASSVTQEDVEISEDSFRS